jgi:hypothetical protein
MQCDPQSGEVSPAPDFDPDAGPPLDVNWSEGVEEFNSMSADELWEYLGLPDKIIPFFNPRLDPDSVLDPWTADGRVWFASEENGTPLALRLYQLVGVAKMLLNAFLGMPVLLMDAVGLGKTIQLIAVIAILTYYREYYLVHGRFPGAFGGSFVSLPCGLSFPPSHLLLFRIHTFSALTYVPTDSKQEVEVRDPQYP